MQKFAKKINISLFFSNLLLMNLLFSELQLRHKFKILMKISAEKITNDT